MSIADFLADTGVTMADLSRTIEVSDGHLADINSGRRSLTLEMAARIEKAVGKEGLVADVVKARTAAA